MPKKRERNSLSERLTPVDFPAGHAKGKDVSDWLVKWATAHNKRRRQRLEIIELHRQDYERNGNPYSVYDAFLHCREGKIGIPEWILDGLENIAREALTLGRPKAAGGPGKLTQYKWQCIRRDAIDAVYLALHENPGILIRNVNELTGDPPDACTIAAGVIRRKWRIKADEFVKLNPDTIRKWFYSDITG